jgi:hypothetical protein
MPLSTGNRYLDAIGGTRWPAAGNTAFDGALLLDVYFDQDTSTGHSTGGAWTPAEELAFWGALHAWESVAHIRFLQIGEGQVLSQAAVDLTELKVTDAEIPGLQGQSDFPDSPTDTPDGPAHIERFNTSHTWTAAAMQPGGYLFGLFVKSCG